MQRFFIVIIILQVFSCKQRGNDSQQNIVTKLQRDSVSFTALIEPSFAEVSTINLTRIGDTSRLQILIRNNVRVDEAQDTFYFKVVGLNTEEYERLDSALLKKARQNIPPKEHVSFDGMSVAFNLYYSGQHYRFGYFSPSKESNEAGYTFTKTFIDNFNMAFKDPIISGYLEEVETYIDESKLEQLTKESQKAIYELRKQKYSR